MKTLTEIRHEARALLLNMAGRHFATVSDVERLLKILEAYIELKGK